MQLYIFFKFSKRERQQNWLGILGLEGCFKDVFEINLSDAHFTDAFLLKCKIKTVSAWKQRMQAEAKCKNSSGMLLISFDILTQILTDWARISDPFCIMETHFMTCLPLAVQRSK